MADGRFTVFTFMQHQLGMSSPFALPSVPAPAGVAPTPAPQAPSPFAFSFPGLDPTSSTSPFPQSLFNNPSPFPPIPNSGLTPQPSFHQHGVQAITPNLSNLFGTSPAGPVPSSTGLTPLASMLSTHSRQTTLANGRSSHPAASNAGGPSKDGELDDIVRAIEACVPAVERLEALLGEIRHAEGAVFSQGKANGAQIETLHVEYVQLLSGLMGLASGTFGALPVPLSLATPDSHAATAETAGQKSSPTVTQLADWSEQRAALEFSKREGVRGSAKSVLDIVVPRKT